MPRRKIGNIVLHIGMHKTGSTAIQAALVGLDESGVRYADFNGQANHSHGLRVAFDPPRESFLRRFGYSRDSFAATRRALRRSLRAILDDPVETLIFSGEDLSILSHDGVAALHEFMAPYTNDFTVVAYVREPTDFARSAILEELKHGRKTEAIPRPNYRRRFEPYVEIFDRSALHFRPYRRKDFPNRDVVADFFAFTGIPKTPPARDTSVNASMGRKTADVLFTINASDALQADRVKANAVRQRIAIMLGGVDREPFVLTPEARAAAIDLEDLAWLERHTGIGFTPRVEADRDAGTLFAPPDLDFVRSYLSRRSLNLRREDPVKALIRHAQARERLHHLRNWLSRQSIAARSAIAPRDPRRLGRWLEKRFQRSSAR